MYDVVEGHSVVQIEGKVFRLESNEIPDSLNPAEKGQASSKILYWNDDTNTPVLENCADVTDHTAFQTPIRDQLDRETCVCFASLANLESQLKFELQTDVDLSEQYANWLYMWNLHKNWCSDGLKTTLAAQYLSVYGVCEEDRCVYEDAATIGGHCRRKPTPTAMQAAKYGIADYTVIDNYGILGPSIANPKYLEAVLCHGHDIVFGVHVAWGRTPDANGVLDVLLSKYGTPLPSVGGHAMLIVGYDRVKEFVICKNSWGTSVGVGGYYNLSYDYVRTYARYGYIAALRRDMPPHPGR
jgi:C1A family cysteine protease